MSKVRKTVLLCCILAAAVLAVYLADSAYRQHEENELEKGQVEKADDGVQIRTKYYTLNCSEY